MFLRRFGADRKCRCFELDDGYLDDRELGEHGNRIGSRR